MVRKKVVLLSIVGLLSTVVMPMGCGRQDRAVSTSQQYPVKPITMIVPFSAGGTGDLMVRAMEKATVKYLGQSLVVSNITGGAGTIGWNELAGTRPDGYTIGYVSPSTLLQSLYGQTRYHYPTALEPLVQVVSTPAVVVVAVDQPWNSIDELVDYARLNPGAIKFGHSGPGTGFHVAGELFGKETGINIAQVPFRGEGESLVALLGGHIQLMFSTPPTVKEYVKAGKVKVLGVLAQHRIADPVFSNVPTLKEQGRDIIYDAWHGIAMPKELPADVKIKLAEGFKEIINDPEFQKQIKDLGMTVDYLGPKEFGEKWINESNRLEKIVKETGIADLIAEQKK